MTTHDLSLLTDDERSLWEYLGNTNAANPVLIDGVFRSLIAARAEIAMLHPLMGAATSAINLAEAENKRKDEALRNAEKALIWASGAFQSEEESAAWAAHGRPIVDEVRALLQSEKGGE